MSFTSPVSLSVIKGIPPSDPPLDDLLRVTEDVRNVSCFPHGGAALQSGAKLGQVVIAPTYLADMRGAEFAQRMYERRGPPVLVLGLFEGRDLLPLLSKVPNAGYVLLSADLEEIVKAAQMLSQGQRYLDPDTRYAQNLLAAGLLQPWGQ